MINNAISIKINKIFKKKDDIQNGLMFVKKLPLDTGALFCMSDTKIHKFWMKNTYISLDVIFLDKNFRVVGFVKKTTPLDLTLVYVNHPSFYVIEINSGFIEKKNIQIGNILKPIYINKKSQKKIKYHKNKKFSFRALTLKR